MSNNSITTIATSDLSTEDIIVANYSLALVIIGTLLNFLTFFILCRSLFRNTRGRPTLHYMRTIAIFDILMLYGWNLDHYIYPIYGYYLQTSSISSCKFLSFLNYFAAQSSAWLRVFVSLDRYLSLSRLHRTWFAHSKHVLIIIACIIGVLFLLNFHFFLFACFYDATGQINLNSSLYQIYPLWDYINLGVYNCAPFIFMVIFNSGGIYHLVRLRRTTMVRNSHKRHRSISITSVITTFLFLIMTVPATVAFGFFSNANPTILRLLDCILYSYHITSFPLYMISFNEFRKECIAIITGKRNDRRVEPLNAAVSRLSYPMQRRTTLKNTFA